MKRVGVKFYTALFVGTGIDAALLALQAPKFTALFAAAGVKISLPCSLDACTSMLCGDKILKFTAA